MAKNYDEGYHVHKPEHGLCGFCGVADPERCMFVYCPKCPPNCTEGLKPEKVR